MGDIVSDRIVDALSQLEKALTRHRIKVDDVYVTIPLKEWSPLKKVVSGEIDKIRQGEDGMWMEIGSIKVVPHDDGWPVD